MCLTLQCSWGEGGWPGLQVKECKEASSTGSQGAAPNQVSLLFFQPLIWGANASAALCW